MFWQVTLTVDRGDVEAADDLLTEAGALSVSSFELDDGPAWRVTALFTEAPSRDDLAELLPGKTPAEIVIEELEDRDWVTENLAGFPPIPIAGFCIHGSHAEPTDKTLTPILIDAGPAFGSGEHATTEGCLIAIDRLNAKNHAVAGALDMGCGSGILAIAIAKRWPEARVLGVDIDAPSVRFAQDAAAANGVVRTITIVEGDGYRAPEVIEAGPFDLIAANILSRPLIAMAPDLAHHLVPGGVAILSGLLSDQAPEVIAAHERQGFDLADRLDLRGWATLIMHKRGR
jgi:ribosomal protein L11 methyltransferase